MAMYPKPVVLCVVGILLIRSPLPLQAALYPDMKPPFAVWVEDGKAKAMIVAEAPKEGTAPAAELNRWLERITGVELPVM